MFGKFISLVIFVILALLALLKSLEIRRNRCLRHAIVNYLVLVYLSKYSDFFIFFI